VADENVFAIGAAMPGHYGPATTGVTLAETTFTAAWNVQGDARRPEFVDRVPCRPSSKRAAMRSAPSVARCSTFR
jgi:hypothetical protein